MTPTEKRLLEDAFRRRAGIMGELQSCLCLYPVHRMPTSTGHDETCPGHRIALSRAAAEKRVVEIGELAVCRVCGCTDDDCSNCIRRTGAPCTWIDPDLCSACEPTYVLTRELRHQRDEARILARVLAHGFQHDTRPSRDVVERSLAFPAMPEEL